MKLLLLLTVLIPLCVSVPTKPGCCVPPVWEGIQGMFSGDGSGPAPELIQQSALISYDEKRQMININITQSIHGLTSDVRILTDYKKGVQYLINSKSRSCTTSKVPQTFQRFCIPDYFYYKGSFNVAFTLRASTEQFIVPLIWSKCKSNSSNFFKMRKACFSRDIQLVVGTCDCLFN
ncbi:hypothetical protein LOTGIDRAFT_160696 [Lottia gigantea]|uniref:NTR domain-containing protein n=1 Tax=Lottia gigantea TaxID=225164 RepID=V4AF93_LOTGI|nr:hypothetical protein LOTGIDRAFT_160696 [Lottia gigantea]ESO95532.1 hypothetical protein LOTGIDRAFT_160696 [Lottia gigantea]